MKEDVRERERVCLCVCEEEEDDVPVTLQSCCALYELAQSW